MWHRRLSTDSLTERRRYFWSAARPVTVTKSLTRFFSFGASGGESTAEELVVCADNSFLFTLRLTLMGKPHWYTNRGRDWRADNKANKQRMITFSIPISCSPRLDHISGFAWIVKWKRASGSLLTLEMWSCSWTGTTTCTYIYIISTLVLFDSYMLSLVDFHL